MRVEAPAALLPVRYVVMPWARDAGSPVLSPIPDYPVEGGEDAVAVRADRQVRHMESFLDSHMHLPVASTTYVIITPCPPLLKSAFANTAQGCLWQEAGTESGASAGDWGVQGSVQWVEEYQGFPCEEVVAHN